MNPVCRSPAHCIEYVHLIQWQQERGAEDFDADEEKHMRWVYDRALQRAEHFGIQVITLGKRCEGMSQSSRWLYDSSRLAVGDVKKSVCVY